MEEHYTPFWERGSCVSCGHSNLVASPVAVRKCSDRNNLKRKDLFWLTAQGTCSSWSQDHSQETGDTCKLLPSSLSPLYSPASLAGSGSAQVSVIKILPYGHAQRPFSQLILGPVKLKIRNHLACILKKGKLPSPGYTTCSLKPPCCRNLPYCVAEANR